MNVNIVWLIVFSLVILFLLTRGLRDTVVKRDAERQARIEYSVVTLFEFAKKIERRAYETGDFRMHAMAVNVIQDIYTQLRVRNDIIEL